MPMTMHMSTPTTAFTSAPHAQADDRAHSCAHARDITAHAHDHPNAHDRYHERAHDHAHD